LLLSERSFGNGGINMESFQESMIEYRKQLEKGTIQKAYKGLMDYYKYLRTYFNKKYPNVFASGNLYFGYMDMSYFALFPKSLKDRNLKIAIVFLHEQFRFEVWLSGVNKKVQGKYWKVFKESNWKKYPIVSTTKNADSIVEGILVENPDFSDLEALTRKIESGILKFIQDIEGFLSDH
jgi:hypothetical protein